MANDKRSNTRQSAIRRRYRRWRRFNVHLFGTIIFNVILWGLWLLLPYEFLARTVVLPPPLAGWWFGVSLISALILAGHYAQVRLANAEDRDLAAQDERHREDEQHRLAHRLHLSDDDTQKRKRNASHNNADLNAQLRN